MINNNAKEGVVMVMNPLTGKMIDIMPLLRLLAGNCYTLPDGGMEGYYLVDRAIEVMATSFDEEMSIKSIKESINDLYRLRRAFGEMKEL